MKYTTKNILKKLVSTLLLLSFISITPAIAGTGHSHAEEKAITTEEVTSLSTKNIKRLIDTGKIDPSWEEVKSDSIEQKTFDHDPEWVVTYSNKQINDASKQTLYMFFSIGGHYLATNYTGE